MEWFTNHKLIKHEDGYILELYLDQQLYEFASEFLETQKEEKQNFEKAVKDYVKKKIPNLKVKTVNIVLGSLLIASLPFSTTSADSGTDLSINNAMQTSETDIYIVESGDTLHEISKKFDTTISELMSSNDLTNDSINVGQQFVLPEAKDHLILVNKSHALSSDYVPKDLTTPEVRFSFEEDHEKKLMREDAAHALEALFQEAKQDNIDLYAVSGYRSYDRQDTIYKSSVERKGEEAANKFSAEPGQSEHQTGLAMDISSESVNYSITQEFGETKEGQWVKKNAHRFGFIIRYEQGKESTTGYQYEPWHLRYVADEAAKKIVNQDITLEEYLDR